MTPKGLSNFNIQGLIIGAAITLVLVAAAFFIRFIWHLDPEGISLPKITAMAGVLNFLVFLSVAAGGWWQLATIIEQHELDRIVAWKGSLQDVNKLIFDKPEFFVPVLYPPDREREDVLKTTAAYTSLNALEIIYHMRRAEKGEHVDADIKQFIETYVSKSEEIKKLWGRSAYRNAFTQDFQKVMNDIVEDPEDQGL